MWNAKRSFLLATVSAALVLGCEGCGSRGRELVLEYEDRIASIENQEDRVNLLFELGGRLTELKQGTEMLRLVRVIRDDGDRGFVGVAKCDRHVWVKCDGQNVRLTRKEFVEDSTKADPPPPAPNDP
jgi:hypothetical protein